MLNINPFVNFNRQFNKYYNNRSVANTQKYPKLAPLQHDTISFTSIEKLNRSLLEAFDNTSVCQQIYENADIASENLRKVLKDSLQGLITTDENPNGAIQRISMRVKTPDSIREKAADKLGIAITSDISKAFNPNNAEEIKQVCGDIVGARIILRKSDIKETSKIIDALIQDVLAGKLKITRIENYEPSDLLAKWEYFDIKDLNRLADAVNKMRSFGEKKVEVISQSKKTGYMALHLDVDLSSPEYRAKNNGYKGEIQIVGCDVANLKDVEDLCYKLKYDKDIKSGNAAYKAFAQYFLKLLHSGSNTEENFVQYTKKAYMHQRRKEPVDNSHRKRKDRELPSLRYCGMEGKLPEGLDFNNLAAIKYHCDKIYELTSDRQKN